MRDEEAMAAVLAEHEYRVGQVAGKAILCVCGWHGKPSDVEPLQEVHRAHVVAELARAGFGSVAAAKAEAWDEVEHRIRHQTSVATVGSMEWRAHLADLAHIEAARADQIGADQ